MGSCCLQGCVGWGGAGVEGRGGCRGGRQQMACHTVRAVGWHPEEEEEGGRKIGGGVGGGGNGRWGGTGIGGALLPKCQQASGETERETEVRSFGGRQAGRQADWREPRDSEISG